MFHNECSYRIGNLFPISFFKSLIIFISAIDDNEDSNNKGNLNLNVNPSSTEIFSSPRNFNSLSTRLLSPDSGLTNSRDDDVGSSLSSASADEVTKLYEQVKQFLPKIMNFEDKNRLKIPFVSFHCACKIISWKLNT